MGWRSWFKGPAKASVASGKRIFAVGDIHGRRDLLDPLLEKLLAHAQRTSPVAENTIVFLGDYVDRGDDSRGVIDWLMQLERTLPSLNVVMLRGNHDQLVLDFVHDARVYRTWRNYGAAQTLLSYGVMPPRFDNESDFVRARDEFVAKCPRTHLEFIDRLRYCHVEGDYVFVHAGIRPGVPIASQASNDLMWIRDEFLLHQRKFEKVVVHGHTPSPAPVSLFNRICVDTGAYGTGRLTALVLEEDRRSFLDVTAKKKAHEVVTLPSVASKISAAR